jgi:hypothetical protein
VNPFQQGKGLTMKLRVLSCTLAMAMVTGSLRAELVDRGTTTYDTETGLEWLDVTQTVGVSAFDILVNGYGGYVADGWALGTVEQLDELFLHAGIPLPHDGLQSPAGFAGANRLIELLGATGSGASVYIQAFSGTLVAATPPFLRHTPVVITSFGSIGGADLLGAIVPSSVANPTIGNYLVRFAGPSTIALSIDVRPWSPRNPVQPGSFGVIPVAVWASPDLDAGALDVASLRFGPAGASPVRGRGLPADLDGDGDLDLLVFFRTRDTGIQCGDVTVQLTGSTSDGTPAEGEDSIVTVGCRP